MKKPSECPDCGYDVTTQWGFGRKLQYACRSDVCCWIGEPFTPPRKKIDTKKVVPLDGGWHYELFDSRGHVMVYSASYSSRKAAVAAANADMERTAKSKLAHLYGEMTAVIWPATVKVRGKVIRMKKRKR